MDLSNDNQKMEKLKQGFLASIDTEARKKHLTSWELW
jgi:hypothetical protein